MKRNEFASKIKNLEATFAVENMTISKNTKKDLKSMFNGEITYKELINKISMSLI